MAGTPKNTSGESAPRQAERPRRRLFPFIVSWLSSAVAMVAAAILPGVSIDDFWARSWWRPSSRC